MVADIDKKKVRKVMRKMHIEMILLKDWKFPKKFQAKVNELVVTCATNLWGHINDGDLSLCDEM